MASESGILYVTMSPQPSLPIAQFHDWYNNEHGPLRLRLPACANGFRYRARDLGSEPSSADKPEWMAIYDFSPASALSDKSYTRLREDGIKTAREADTMAQIDVNRRFFDLVKEWKATEWVPLEHVPDGENHIVAVSLIAKPGRAEDVKAWYVEEHVDLLSRVPGWRRTRLFVASSQEPAGVQRSSGEGETEFLALHDYAPDNGIGGKEFLTAVGTERSKNVLGVGGVSKEDAAVRIFARRLWGLYYTFGAAPRDLKSLCGGGGEGEAVSEAWEYSDRKTRTAAKGVGPTGVVESYIATKDDVELDYRLEGCNGGDDAPVLLLVNSVLVNWSIWDAFVEAFLANNKFSAWRILRFNVRGRKDNAGSGDITLDMLTEDIVEMLDALRIVKVDAAVGVSLGGATVLNLALKHSERLGSFVACDTNSKAPPSNPQAWGERIEMSEKQRDPKGRVGSHLADATVKRWFPEESFLDVETKSRIEKVRHTIEENSLNGFKKGVKALYDYDMEGSLGNCKVRGALVVGEKDGKLPQGMKDMAGKLGSGAELKVIPGAGHLPMIDKPEEVVQFVQEFLDGSDTRAQ